MTPSEANLDFQVRKHDLHVTRCVESAAPDTLPAGSVLCRVDRFALTANNITYAAYGEILDYWQFYPAPEGWGRIPVWGYADVVASEHAEVAPGERLFGYWPMSTYAVLTPAQVDAGTLVEGAPQRAQLNPFYNRYQRCAADPAYQPAQEDWQSLFRPLVLTAFLLDEFLAEENFWGAQSVMLTSASSKTAFSLAMFLRQRGRCEVVGLTSASNIEFLGRLGCYDRVLEYAELEQQDAAQASAVVDMAGNTQVLARIHEHFATNLCKSVTVGGTHWQAIGAAQGLPGPEPEFFFAPSHIGQRIQDWGAGEFQQRFAAAWARLLPRVQASIELIHGQGMDALEDVYRALLDGSAAPDKGYIIQL